MLTSVTLSMITNGAGSCQLLPSRAKKQSITYALPRPKTKDAPPYGGYIFFSPLSVSRLQISNKKAYLIETRRHFKTL